MTVARTIVTAPDVAPPIGPYRHAVRAGGLLFCSGQLGVDATGSLVGEDPAEQARQALENLTRVCRAAGAKLADAARIGIFLRDFAHFPAINEVYASFFPAEPPARTTVAVAGLPLDGWVEIEAVVSLAG